MSAYYNENDPFAAQWLRNLIAQNLIAPGDVDERSIVDVQPDDLLGYDQCHFFAGIGGWSYSLRLAGWPDDEPVWTGSCPCQPFSVAGKQDGHKDERHLYPEWSHLIRKRKPPVIFGEQVEGAIRHGWLDAVQGDLEAKGYAFGTAILGAHSVGAPHIRQRVWFVAHSEHAERRTERQQHCDPYRRNGFGRSSNADLLGDSNDAGLEGRNIVGSGCTRELASGQAGMADELEYAESDGLGSNRCTDNGSLQYADPAQESDRRRRIDGWSDLEWLPCRDGKARPTQPGLFPLADGIPGRVGRLRAYGNAIVPQVAAEFIQAYRECRP